jgi:hypothetical protein
MVNGQQAICLDVPCCCIHGTKDHAILVLQISGQFRRKPWNRGPIRRFFGREFQVFVIKSTAKASDEKSLSW